MVTLIHHAATCGSGHPLNAPAAVRACLERGAQIVEVDIAPLADGRFLLAHDARLEDFSDGWGPVAAATAGSARRLRYRIGDAVTAEPLGLLEDVLALLPGGGLAELQLDLKSASPLPERVLAGLAELLTPHRGRVRVSSPADWDLRALHRLDPDLPLGFDPLLYLDLEWPDTEERKPPPRAGAYGYHDEHPLAFARWGSVAAYLAARAEALWQQAPMCGVWYIRGQLLARALDDGFDWIAWLHAHNALVAAWTLDPEHPHQRALAQRLAGAGVDRITTNDVAGMSAALYPM